MNPRAPFKGRQYPGEVIIGCVRWYLRYPLSYEHVSEMMARGAKCIFKAVRVVSLFQKHVGKRKWTLSAGLICERAEKLVSCVQQLVDLILPHFD